MAAKPYEGDEETEGFPFFCANKQDYWEQKEFVAYSRLVAANPYMCVHFPVSCVPSRVVLLLLSLIFNVGSGRLAFSIL